MSRNDSTMRSAIGRIGSGSVAGTPATHSVSSVSVILQASASDMPLTRGARASSDSLVPPHSGQTSSFKNRSTRFMPFSSFTFCSAFSTVYFALK